MGARKLSYYKEIAPKKMALISKGNTGNFSENSSKNCLDYFLACPVHTGYGMLACPVHTGLPNRYEASNEYRYGFNGMEKDDEVAGEGNIYTAEFWQYDSRLGRRWNIDPVVKEHESPYTTFANNPIIYRDPNGADTVDIIKSGEFWVVSQTQLAEGDDVFRVNDGHSTTIHTFSDATYGNRINVLRLTSDDQQTFSIYHLSGTQKTGYIVEPNGKPTAESGKDRPIPEGAYNLTTSERGNNWSTGQINLFNDQVPKGRAIYMHYGSQAYGKGARGWSKGCLIVSSNYTVNEKGYIIYNMSESQEAVWEIHKYLGATSRNKKGNAKKRKNRHWYKYNSKTRIESSKVIIQTYTKKGYPEIYIKQQEKKNYITK